MVWWDALCGCRLQHQALRCGVSTTEVYAMRKLEAAMQGGAAETVVVRRAIPAGLQRACRRCVVVAAAGLCVGVW
jgi:hypothetical protein